MRLPRIERHTFWLDDDCTDGVQVCLLTWNRRVCKFPMWVDDWLIPALWVRPFVDEDEETAGCTFTFFWFNRVLFEVERVGEFPGLRLFD